MNNPINDESWRKLYDQAIAIKKISPWQWMEAGQIFAIEDPLSKVNYYCSVNSTDEMDSVQIFIGEEGINRRIVSLIESEREEFDETSDELSLGLFLAPFDEYSYQCNFCEQGFLEDKEEQRIKRLGYHFHGDKESVAFQVSVPGHVRRDVATEEEAEILLRILSQINTIALLEKEKGFVGGLIDVTAPAIDVFWWRYDPQKGQWSHSFRKLEEIMGQIALLEYPNQLFLRRVSKLKYSKKVYEIVRLFIPSQVEDEQRLYFPVMFMLVDLDTGMVAFEHVDIMNDDGFGARLLDDLSRFFIRQGSKPAQILCADFILQQFLSNYCADTRISNEFLEETIAGNELLHDFLEAESRNDEEFGASDRAMDKDVIAQLLQNILETEDTDPDASFLEMLHKITGKDILPVPSPQPPGNQSNLIDMFTRQPIIKAPK